MSEAAGVDDDDVQGWVESIIGLCASALGIYVAHRLDDVVFLYGACGAGAALAVDKCAELGFSFKPRAPPRRRRARGCRASPTRRRASGPGSRSSSAGRCSPSARRRRACRRWPTASGRRRAGGVHPLAADARAAGARACIVCMLFIPHIRRC